MTFPTDLSIGNYWKTRSSVITINFHQSIILSIITEGLEHLLVNYYQEVFTDRFFIVSKTQLPTDFGLSRQIMAVDNFNFSCTVYISFRFCYVFYFILLYFLFCSWSIGVYDFHWFGLCLMLVLGYALEHDLIVGRSWTWDFNWLTNQIKPNIAIHYKCNCGW